MGVGCSECIVRIESSDAQTRDRTRKICDDMDYLTDNVLSMGMRMAITGSIYSVYTRLKIRGYAVLPMFDNAVEVCVAEFEHGYVPFASTCATQCRTFFSSLPAVHASSGWRLPTHDALTWTTWTAERLA
jgi:hypothetical protein